MKTRQFVLVLGDIALLYISLFLSLIIRYLGNLKPETLNIETHAGPFTVLFALWILSFYVANLYSLNTLTNFFLLARIFIVALSIDVMFSATYFYINPEIFITPKTILALTATIFTILFLSWRYLASYLWRIMTHVPFVIVGNNYAVQELKEYLEKFPHLGYRLESVIDEYEIDRLKNNHTSLIVVSRQSFDSVKVAQVLYSMLRKKITVVDLADFSELIMGKIQISAIDQLWFLRNLREGNKRVFDFFKRIFDAAGAIIIAVLFSPLAILISMLIKTTSKGPLFYEQKRVGQSGKIFTMTKFRTMVENAEQQGKPQWAQSNDPRITKVGKLIRKLRLDEIPQLWNILIGEMSFVGPRPERPEFVEELKKKISFYEERLLLKPGLSGWAQINYPYAASIDDAVKKLEYDLYYLKNRSPLLDLSIVLKTIYIVLSGKGT